MWGKNKRKDIAKSHNVPFETLISSKTSMEGDIQFSGGLHIDGLIKGTIRSTDDQEAVVRISDIGEIDGDVIAPHIIINGTVYGDVYASKHVELAENASVKGNVYYNLIEMAMGAEVNGNLVHQKQPSPEDQVVADKENASDAVALKAVASQGE